METTAEVELLSQSDNQCFCELLSHIVSMQDQLAEYHSYSTDLEGLIFVFLKECRAVEGRGTWCFFQVVMYSHKLSLVNKFPAHLQMSVTQTITF